MGSFKLKARAKADLKDIANYTEKTWGRGQRNKYLRDFDSAFQKISENPDLGRLVSHVRPGYRVLAIGSHLIFYRLNEGREVEIIRILHKRMDVSLHL